MVKVQSPFGLFWSVIYLNFEEKLQIRTAHHTFIESRHPEVTKNPYYAFSPKGRQKKVSSHGLIPVCRSVCIHPKSVFWRYSSLSRKGEREWERIMELNRIPILNQREYWSQIFRNSTIFATFTFLVYVLLCNNLALSMLNCEGSLT